MIVWNVILSAAVFCTAVQSVKVQARVLTNYGIIIIIIIIIIIMEDKTVGEN